MATTRFADHLLAGIHSARPAASAVPAGTLYSCSTHSIVYQSDGSSAWSNYIALAGNIAADTIWDAKGDLLAASAADTAARLPVGSNNQLLVADSGQTLGVKWAAAPSGAYIATDTLWDTKGDLAVATAADTASKLAVGSNGQILTADSTQTTGVKWATAAGGGGVTELSYVQFTSLVSVTATTEAGATTIVTAASFTADGTTKYRVDFGCYSIVAGSGPDVVIVVLFLDGSAIGQLAESHLTSNQPVGVITRFHTPSAGSRTYSVRAYRGSSNGLINASAGGAGTPMPGFIRVSSGG